MRIEIDQIVQILQGFAGTFSGIGQNGWIWLVIGTALGVGVGFLLARHKLQQRLAEKFESGLQSAAASHAEQLNEAGQAMRLVEDEVANLQHRLATAVATHEAAQSALQHQLNTSQAELELKREALAHTRAEHAAAQARLDEAAKGFAEKEALFKETSAALKQEFELLANKVFESQDKKQQASLQTVLTPFKDQIVDFKKRVEEVYHTETKERASLLGEIKNLQAASERINEEAENLTKALKGDKKLQGNWGELVLERVLEESGLRRDHEYLVQASLRNEAGDLKRPDVIIRLPEAKDVVIDSKVTLNSYEEALSCEDEELRGQLLRAHLSNLRNHVKRLSEQDYDQLPDVRSLDFVLLFIPIESAFTLAMEADPKLFTEAFNQRIVIVSPTTLMMTLRIINNVWRYEKQNNNAQEIAKRAGALYDKLRVLVEEMEKLGKQLNTAERTYSDIYKNMTTGRANLVRQVEKFRELGAQVKKPMDGKLLERAEDEVE